MTQRVQEQPAWLLHHRPFRDSSRIIDFLCRDHGRISVVARGARSAKSRLRGILRPFMPLSISWVSRSDLGTLTGAELDGAPLSLQGDTLMSGYYVNELLLKLTHRHDPQPGVFTAYGHTVERLAGTIDAAPVLREFEIVLLRELGYALNLADDGVRHEQLVADDYYEYRVEQGAVPVSRSEGGMVFSGRELSGIREGTFSDPHILKCAGRLLRGVIAFHLDGRELMSRKVLRELRAARDNRDPEPRKGTPI